MDFEKIAIEVRKKIAKAVFDDKTPSRDMDRVEYEIIATALHQVSEQARREACAREKKMLEEIEEPLKKINPEWDGWVWIADNFYTPPKNFTRFNLGDLIRSMKAEGEGK